MTLIVEEIALLIILKLQIMENIVLFALVGLAVCGMLITMWNDRQENKRMKEDLELRQALAIQQVVPGQPQPLQHKTRELFIDTLTKIGCQYQLGEGDDTRIFFAYQGENFFCDTTNDIMYVHLWDTYWGHVELYDIDEVSRLRKAINTSNINTTVSTVYTIDEAESNIVVHCKATIPFVSTMPHLEEYLKVELNDFFRAHQLVGNEMHKLREKERK